MNSPLAQGFSIGDRVIKPREGTIAHADDEVHVEPKVMDLLICLAEHGGEVVSRQQLIDSVWGHSFGQRLEDTHLIGLPSIRDSCRKLG